MKKFKVVLIALIVALVLTYLLYTVNLLANRVDVLEHSIGIINWDIEEIERELGFLQLEILTFDQN